MCIRDRLISIDVEKAFDKVQHPFMIKNHSAKGVYREHTSE